MRPKDVTNTYGRSFASKLIQDGNYDQAVVEATRALETEGSNPEHFADRAQALAELGRNPEALADFEKAFSLDEAAAILDTDLLDDAYFSALLVWAREVAQKSVAEGIEILKRYQATRASGRHVQDAAEWAERISGHRKTEFVKRRMDEN